jgi:glutaredoxin 2
MLPDFVNRTEGRREAKRLTGKTAVPVLVTDDGEVVAESNIARWAMENAARRKTASSGL